MKKRFLDCDQNLRNQLLPACLPSSSCLSSSHITWLHSILLFIFPPFFLNHVLVPKRTRVSKLKPMKGGEKKMEREKERLIPITQPFFMFNQWILFRIHFFHSQTSLQEEKKTEKERHFSLSKHHYSFVRMMVFFDSESGREKELLRWRNEMYIKRSSELIPSFNHSNKLWPSIQ